MASQTPARRNASPARGTATRAASGGRAARTRAAQSANGRAIAGDVDGLLPAPAPMEGERPDGSELTRALSELGLSHNEARLYVALLELSDATAAQLSRTSGVARPKVYEALGALETRGFCSTVGDRVTRYRPVAAGAALGDWIRHRDHERAARSEREQALGEMLVRLLPAPAESRTGPAAEFLEAITGRASTSAALEQIIGRAERSVWMLMQPPWVQSRARWNVAEVAAARRGVQVRVAYTPAAIQDRKRYDDLVRAGGDCRLLDEIPMKLLVRDGVEALVSLRDARSGEQTITSVAMNHPDLARALAMLFEQQWSRAAPLPEAAVER